MLLHMHLYIYIRISDINYNFCSTRLDEGADSYTTVSKPSTVLAYFET